MVRFGMVIDLDKCTACQACTIVCKEENNVPEGAFWNQVLSHVVGKYPSVRVTFIPRPCMHCKKAPCVEVCPVKATYKRTDGIVITDYDKCIGCRYCIAACPYGARYFTGEKLPVKPTYGEVYKENVPYWNPDVKVPLKHIATKCTFCKHRVDKGIFVPACVEECPSKARYFGDLDDPTSEVSRLLASRHHLRLKEELGTEPQVYYLV